jgi:hypothetical protein
MFTKFAYSPAYCQTGILENNSLISNVFPNIDTVSDIWFFVFVCSADIIVRTLLILYKNRIILAIDRIYRFAFCCIASHISHAAAAPRHIIAPHQLNIIILFYSNLIWRPQFLHGQFIGTADSRTRRDPFSSFRTFDTDPTTVTITSNVGSNNSSSFGCR